MHGEVYWIHLENKLNVHLGQSVVKDDGDSSEIIDRYDRIMTKVNVCINAYQQHIFVFLNKL